MTGTTTAILDTIRGMGYAVSEFKLSSSLYGKFQPAIEMHAVKLDSCEQFIARVGDEGEDSAYRCACVLAGMVGIEMEE